MCVKGLDIIMIARCSSERGLVHVHEGLVVGVERSILGNAQNEVVASQVIQVSSQHGMHVPGDLFRRALGRVVDRVAPLPKEAGPGLGNELVLVSQDLPCIQGVQGKPLQAQQHALRMGALGRKLGQLLAQVGGVSGWHVATVAHHLSVSPHALRIGIGGMLGVVGRVEPLVADERVAGGLDLFVGVLAIDQVAGLGGVASLPAKRKKPNQKHRA